ncbi:MAG: alpha-mannosidase [Anaerolineaceae bacterium]|nr:alpha-mannosidase [Anaerolineaceae bacterium]
MFHEIRLTPKKIAQRLALIRPLVQRRRAALPPFQYLRLEGPLVEPPVGVDVDDSSGWQTVREGDYWGDRQANFILRGSFQFPPDWDADLWPTALYLTLGESLDFSHPEALVYIDGQPYSGCDRHHRLIFLPAEVCDGQSHRLALHGWAGMIDSPPNTRMLMGPCALVQIDPEADAFVSLAAAALESANALDENTPARAHLYTALNEAFKRLDLREPLDDRFYDSLQGAAPILRAGIDQAGVPLEVDIYAAGNAHIDVAWLWTVGQARRKSGRSFYNVVRLMERYPEFIFSQSQPQLYDFIRQDYPELFEEIRQRVDEGRWEPLGGMWVEADCNITGSESLARQFLLGRSFFRQHFGRNAESPVLWLPDVFGYTWNLPQLIKEAGLEYFFTIKIGWNQYNHLPYDSFWWQGLDGTRVLTHFSPTPDPGSAYAATYTAMATPSQVLATWTHFKQKDWGKNGEVPPMLMAYGYGDGGGGPTREMIKTIRNLDAFPAMPRIRCSTVAEFFHQLDASSGGHLPTWNGELYLEYHRGTYTSQSRNKRANRKSEFLLHDCEFLAVLAAQMEPEYAYPAADLQAAWQTVCLNQFHDILPGSSITPVYSESLEQYARLEQSLRGLQVQSQAAISRHLAGDLILANPTSFACRQPVFWPGSVRALKTLAGLPVAVQPVEGGLLLDAGQLPPYSLTPLVISEERDDHENSGATLRGDPGPALAAPESLENDFLRVELNPAGDITRIYDKANRREVLPPGAIANQLQAFEDRPVYWDAWDLDIFYDDKVWLAAPADSIRMVENGPLRAAIEIHRQILNSAFVQRISLSRHSARLDFETHIDWRERHVLLKVAFPVDVLAAQASYEIQWGSVQRPTHRNTSWDWARFESCAQKWVDLSEGDYGVSLLNDCKYGHDIRDNVMRLSLLRSPTSPDPEADHGEQRYAYSLIPHSGGWDERTIAAAYALNDPPLVWQGVGAAGSATANHVLSMLQVDRPNVVIETVKRAEDGRGWIVRLYESQRMRGAFTLTSAFPLAEIWRDNLIEDDQQRLEPDENRLTFDIKPFQIMTLRLVPSR